jgi:hypothetical protein
LDELSFQLSADLRRDRARDEATITRFFIIFQRRLASGILSGAMRG